MSHYRTMRLVVAGAALALAGCAATTPERGGQAATADATTRIPTASGSTPDAGAKTVFEAMGIAYLGGNRPFSQIREHAYNESKTRLFDAGAPIHLNRIQATTFGTLTTDCAMQVVSGTLVDFQVLEEGIENEARYFVRSQARFEQREAEKALEVEALKKAGCWSGDAEPEPGAVAETPTPDVPKVAAAVEPATVKDSAANPMPNADPAPKHDSRTSATGGPSVSTSEAETQTAESRPPEPAAETPTTVPIISVPAADTAADTTVCCHEFPETLSRRVYPVLSQMGGVTLLQRLATVDGSLCYRFRYDGPLEPLERRLESDIRTSATLSFKIRHDRGQRIIDLVFDGGFD